MEKKKSIYSSRSKGLSNMNNIMDFLNHQRKLDSMDIIQESMDHQLESSGDQIVAQVNRNQVLEQKIK